MSIKIIKNTIRLIDANALRADFVDRYHKAEDWIVKAKDEEIKTRAEATRDFIGEVIMTIDNAPTVTPDKIQAIMSDYLVYRCEPQRPQGEWIKKGGEGNETNN